MSSTSIYSTSTLRIIWLRFLKILLKRAVALISGFPNWKYKQLQQTHKKIAKANLNKRLKALTFLNSRLIEMQTSAMLGMAYHIKKLFHVKLGKKDNKNWCNNKNTEKEE